MTRTNCFIGLILALLLQVRPVHASGITFSLPSGNLSGNAGSTIGFGYQIANTTSSYYQPELLESGGFITGTPLALFDYPEVAPGATVTVNFSTAIDSSCAAPDCGLFEIALTGQPGQSDAGTFVMDGELFGDVDETLDAGTAPTLAASYTVTITQPAMTTVPESGPLGLILVTAGAFCILHKQVRSLCQQAGLARLTSALLGWSERPFRSIDAPSSMSVRRPAVSAL